VQTSLTLKKSPLPKRRISRAEEWLVANRLRWKIGAKQARV
jgi:hypothetical protein